MGEEDEDGKVTGKIVDGDVYTIDLTSYHFSLTLFFFQVTPFCEHAFP